jgi:hypothetical protein
MARHRIPLVIAAAVLAVAGLAGPAAADDDRSRLGRAIPPIEEASPATNCRVIDFESAQVRTLPTVPPQRALVVRGEKPYLNMQVNLVPLVYIRQPEYWGIEATGCLPGVGLPAVADYVVKLDLEGTIGTCGIEVIGADHSEKIDIPATRHQ